MGLSRAELAARLHAVSDDQWGRTVRIIPMRRGGAYGSEAGVDLARRTVEVVGIFRRFDAQSVGLVGERSGLPFISRAGVEETSIAISDEALAAANCKPRQGDIVILIESGERFEISRTDPSHYGRTKFQLIESQAQ